MLAAVEGGFRRCPVSVQMLSTCDVHGASDWGGGGGTHHANLPFHKNLECFNCKQVTLDSEGKRSIIFKTAISLEA